MTTLPCRTTKAGFVCACLADAHCEKNRKTFSFLLRDCRTVARPARSAQTKTADTTRHDTITASFMMQRRSLIFLRAMLIVVCAFFIILSPFHAATADGGNDATLRCSERVCRWDEFCELAESGSVCNDCQSCSGRINADICRSADCSCRSNSDCRTAQYCEKSSELGLCRSCDSCAREAYQDPSSGQRCPSRCLCESSSECPDGLICGTQGLSLPPGFGVCHTCDAHDDTVKGSDCVDEWLVSSSDSCQDLCPAQMQCNRHEDCPNRSTDYCSKDHKCRRCDHNCAQVSESGVPLNTTDPSVLPRMPIDNGFCPQSCCGWGQNRDDLVSPYYTQAHLVMQVCDASLEYDFYLIRTSDPSDDKTAQVFRDTGQPCMKRTWSNGSFVGFTCDIAEPCATVDLAVGVVVQDSNSGTVDFVNNEAYPYTASFSVLNLDGTSCRQIPLTPIITSVGLVVVLMCSFIGYSVTQRRRRRQRPASHYYPRVETPPVSDDSDDEMDGEDDDSITAGGGGGGGRLGAIPEVRSGDSNDTQETTNE